MYLKKAEYYFKKHPVFNAIVHAIGGMGVGILLMLPMFDPHPLRWGVAFLVISILGHVYAAQSK